MIKARGIRVAQAIIDGITHPGLGSHQSFNEGGGLTGFILPHASFNAMVKTRARMEYQGDDGIENPLYKYTFYGTLGVGGIVGAASVGPAILGNIFGKIGNVSSRILNTTSNTFSRVAQTIKFGRFSSGVLGKAKDIASKVFNKTFWKVGGINGLVGLGVDYANKAEGGLTKKEKEDMFKAFPLRVPIGGLTGRAVGWSAGLFEQAWIPMAISGIGGGVETWTVDTINEGQGNWRKALLSGGINFGFTGIAQKTAIYLNNASGFEKTISSYFFNKAYLSVQLFGGHFLEQYLRKKGFTDEEWKYLSYTKKYGDIQF